MTKKVEVRTPVKYSYQKKIGPFYFLIVLVYFFEDVHHDRLHLICFFFNVVIVLHTRMKASRGKNLVLTKMFKGWFHNIFEG